MQGLPQLVVVHEPTPLMLWHWTLVKMDTLAVRHNLLNSTQSARRHCHADKRLLHNLSQSVKQTSSCMAMLLRWWAIVVNLTTNLDSEGLKKSFCDQSPIPIERQSTPLALSSPGVEFTWLWVHSQSPLVTPVPSEECSAPLLANINIAKMGNQDSRTMYMMWVSWLPVLTGDEPLYSG